MRPSDLQLTLRWLIFTAWIVGLDAAAANWTIAARTLIPMGGVGGGDHVWYYYSGYDGSRVSVGRDVTGTTTVYWTHPPTATGLCYVWWPAVAGAFITLAILGLAATRNGRRLIGEFPLPPMTTRRLMMAVAVIALEAMLIINMAKSNRVNWDFLNYRRPSPWPPILVCLAAPPTFLLVALGRTRSTGAQRNSFGRKQ